MGTMDDFYEQDEPLDDVLKAFNEGDKGVTARPTRGQTALLLLKGGRTVEAPRIESARGTQGQTALLDLAAA